MEPMKARQANSPLLPKEVGERLRLLRTRAGLSQEAVARLVGLPERGGRSWVCQVERGYLKSGPGFIRMLDFLRACGCGIDAVMDILDRHTSRQTAREERTAELARAAIANMPPRALKQAFYYEVGLRRKAGIAVRNAVAAEQRVRQVAARARAQLREKRLKRLFNDELNKLHLAWGHTLAISLRAYGSLVFATLRRLRGARPVWREKALARLDTWPEMYGYHPAPFRQMKAAVTGLFNKLAAAGKLD